jgi:phage shock protein A
MGLFKRITMIFKSKANAALDEIEDAVQMTEQGIRTLKEKWENAIKAEAKFKAMITGLKSDQKKLENDKVEWENKANQLQDRIDNDPTKVDEIEPLIVTALDSAEKCGIEATSKTQIIEGYDVKYKAMVAKVKELRELIVESENNLVQLKARKGVADASVAVNKELSNIGGLDSTKEMMKRMEAKVAEQENLADAYVGVDEDNKTNADKINDILKNTSSKSASDKLAAFRANRSKTV